MTIKIKYDSEQSKVIKITYDTTPVYISTSVSSVYIKVAGIDQSGIYVPYSLATRNVDLGEFGITAGYYKIDTTPTNTPNDQGTMYWDDSRETVALIMDGTIQHIGQDSYFYVKNITGSSIPKGTAVRFAGTNGASGHILIAPFIANGTYPSAYFMGVTSEPIGNGEFGQVVNFGELEGINTSTYTAGDLLYASTTVAGAFQTTAPIAPNNIILVAAAINSKNNGAIIVRPFLGSNINNDEGVKIISVSNNQTIKFNSSNSLFENKSIVDLSNIPSTAISTGVAGDLKSDGSYLYVCTATNTWKRTQLLSW
jgi:hypothetical protein